MPLRFDRFLVDDAGRRLLRDGADVHLTPKALELLLLLVEKRPAAVSKAAIMNALWPDTHVLEANVSNLVGEVRAALGEDSAQPRFIRTVPRYGYSFQADLARPLPPSPASPSASAVPLPTPAGPGGPQAGPPSASPLPVAVASLLSLVTETRRLPLPVGSTILGREGVAAELLNSPLVSRQHARIDVVGDLAFIEDLGSKNGCTVEGQRISGRVQLTPGHRIGIGPIVVRLVRDDEDATRTYFGQDLLGL